MKPFSYDITNDPKVTDFLEMRDLKQSTQDSYIIGLRQYCQFCKKTAEELIDEARQEERENIIKSDRKIKKRLTRYRNYLKKKYSNNTVKSRVKIVKTFYGEFGIDLPKVPLKLKNDETLITAEDIPSKKHIKQVLKHCNLKYRAIILLMANSGMGGAEIRNLTNNDFIKSLEIPIKEPFDIGELRQKAEENHVDILTWKPTRQRTDMKYFTFSGPESLNALFDYLEQKYKIIPFNSKDWLFGTGSKKLARRSFLDYFQKLNDKCEFGYVGSHRFFTAHKLRYYFATMAHKNHAREMDTDWMLGHSIQRILGVYTKPSIPDLKREYMRLLPYLSIEKVKVKDVHTPEFKELKNKLKEKDKRIDNLEAEKEAHAKRLDELEKLAKMNKQIKEVKN